MFCLKRYTFLNYFLTINFMFKKILKNIYKRSYIFIDLYEQEAYNKSIVSEEVN